MSTPAPTNVPCGWKYSHAITIDRSKCGTVAQTNISVLVALPANCLTTGNDEACQSDGGDLRFTSDAAGKNGLNCEVVSITLGSPGSSQVWVKIPTLNSSAESSDTVIYVWYHYLFGTIAQPAASDSTWGSQGVWSNGFDAVYHCEDAAGATTADSTANAHTGTNTAMASDTGQIGNAGSYNGGGANTSKVDCGDYADNPAAITVEFWLKTSSVSQYNAIISKGGNYGVPSWAGWGIFTHLAPGKLYIQLTDATGNYYCQLKTSSAVNDGVLHHCVVTFKSPYMYTNANIYIDGSLNNGDHAVAGTPSSVSTTVSLLLGYGVGYNHLDGLLDEIRISNVVRSQSWITAEYNNQSSPSTFSTASGAGTHTAWWQSLGFLGVGQ